MNSIESVTLCQQRVDTKGFKGKGGVETWVRNVVSRLNAVREDMAALASASNQVAPRYFHLQLHARSATGSLSLRWRFTTGKHALWKDLAPHLTGVPQRIADWYRAANEEAELLNAMEQALRAELRMAERLAIRMGVGQQWQRETGLRSSIVSVGQQEPNRKR
ncbi:MAG: hypothetical protein V4568_01690 [Pseudomonadota bacterium]